MNKRILIASALLAALYPATVFAYDVFSYRYDYSNQSDSTDSKPRSSEAKFVEPNPAPVPATRALARESTPERLKPNRMPGFSKHVMFSNTRK